MTKRFDAYSRSAVVGLEGDIRRACGYITDDQYIASYFGVTIERVRMERLKLPKGKPAHINCPAGRGGPVLPGNEAEWRAKAVKSNREFITAWNRFLANREAKMRRAG